MTNVKNALVTLLILAVVILASLPAVNAWWQVIHTAYHPGVAVSFMGHIAPAILATLIPTVLIGVLVAK